MRVPFQFAMLGLATTAVCFEIIRTSTSLSYLACVMSAVAVVAPIYLFVYLNPIATVMDHVLPRLRERYEAAALPGERKLKLFQMNLGSLFFLQAVAAFFYLLRISTDLDIVTSAIISVAATLFFRVFFDLPFFFAIGVEWVVQRLSSTVELDRETNAKSE